MDEEGHAIKLFDVTMGCFDDAEVFQLVGTFVLATLSKKIPSGDIALYRDDGLGALWNMPGSQADWIRKDVMRIFEEVGLRITIQTILKVADFLDRTFNLDSESSYPYRKPNDRPVYIHSQSNPPPPPIPSRTYLLSLVVASRIYRAMRMHLEMPNQCTTKL